MTNQEHKESILGFVPAVASVVAVSVAVGLLLATAYVGILPTRQLGFDLTVLVCALSVGGVGAYLAYRFRPRDRGAFYLRSRRVEDPLSYQESWILDRHLELASWAKVEMSDPKELMKLKQFLKEELGVEWALEGVAEVLPNGTDTLKLVTVKQVVAIKDKSWERLVKITPIHTSNKFKISVSVEKEALETTKPDDKPTLDFNADLNGKNQVVSIVFPTKKTLSNILQKKDERSNAQVMKLNEKLSSQISGCIPYKTDDGQRLRYELNWLKKVESSKDPGSPKQWYRVKQLLSDILEVLQRRRGKIIDNSDQSATTLGLNEFSEVYSKVRNLEALADKSIRTLVLDRFLNWIWILIFIPLAFPLGWITGSILQTNQFDYVWWTSIWLVGGISVIGFYPLFVYATNHFKKEVGNVVDYLVAGLVSASFLAVIFTLMMAEAIHTVPQSVYVNSVANGMSFLSDPVNKIMTAAIGTLLGVLILKDSVSYGLTRASGTQPLIYDEALVSAVQKIVVLYGLIVASGLLVIAFGLAPAADTTIIYLLLLSVITAVIGYASKETLENFFAGLILRVNPPFKKGDRVIIRQGEVSDVREIGVRTTRLYDVESHTEIYYPNKSLVDERIVNVSRPDPQLRVSTSFFIRANEQTDLKKVTLILLDIAYAEDEVEQALIDDSDLGNFATGSDTRRQLDDKVRVVVEKEVNDLENRFPEIRNAEVPSTRNMKREPHDFHEISSKVLCALKKAKPNYDKDTLSVRYEKVNTRLDGVQQLSNAVFALSDQHPELREEFEPLLAELSREPSVSSEFEKGAVKLTLYVFIQHLEMRMHVEGRLNEIMISRLKTELPQMDFIRAREQIGTDKNTEMDWTDAGSDQ